MEAFWNKKRVLVTGASGFIGSWLTEELVKRGAEITALVNMPDPFGVDAIRHLKKHIDIVSCDIREREKIGKLVKDYAVIFHLAAITQVLWGIQHPCETVEVNMLGTQYILEGVRKHKKNQFLVFVSTDKIYGEPEYLPLDEHHPLLAKSPYDASKVGADRLVYAYHKTYGLRATMLRWANTYGGRDANILRAVPDFILSVLANRPPLIRGNGKHVRDFLYVSDVVNALLLAAQRQDASNGEAFNLGTKKPTSIEDLARLIIALAGKKNMRPEILHNKTPGEINTQYLAYEKAKKMLSWEPAIDLPSGLAMAIQWYQENPTWGKTIKRVSKFYS